MKRNTRRLEEDTNILVSSKKSKYMHIIKIGMGKIENIKKSVKIKILNVNQFIIEMTLTNCVNIL